MIPCCALLSNYPKSEKMTNRIYDSMRLHVYILYDQITCDIVGFASELPLYGFGR